MNFFCFSLIYILSIFLGVAQAEGIRYQPQSETKWGEINLADYLSFKSWKDQSDERQLEPAWETIVKERNHKEIVGRFFQCVGLCRIDRGGGFFKPSFKTTIYEGDELQTIGESYAWIYLYDGTMIRLSPESSINLNELNIGVKENFLHVRVNAGNILWLSRHEGLFTENNQRETDVLFNPLNLYEAIATPDKKMYREEHLIELVEEKETVLNQYKNLNQLIEKNNLVSKNKKTYAFIVAPNITIMGYNPSVEITSLIGGKSFIKNRSGTLLGLKDFNHDDTFIQLRGFENNEEIKLEADKWFAVDEKGKSLTEETEHTYWLTMSEFITKHIPSLMVARELMFKEFSEFCYKEKYDPMVLATDYGYRLWGSLKSENKPKEDLELRLDFLKEYFRRTETTNLVVSTQFSNRLRERGENIKSMEYGNFFFIKALDKYYSYEDYNEDSETGELLNSTQKVLWKKMHGLK